MQFPIIIPFTQKQLPQGLKSQNRPGYALLRCLHATSMVEQMQKRGPTTAKGSIALVCLPTTLTVESLSFGSSLVCRLQSQQCQAADLHQPTSHRKLHLQPRSCRSAPRDTMPRTIPARLLAVCKLFHKDANVVQHKPLVPQLYMLRCNL